MLPPDVFKADSWCPGSLNFRDSTLEKRFQHTWEGHPYIFLWLASMETLEALLALVFFLPRYYLRKIFTHIGVIRFALICRVSLWGTVEQVLWVLLLAPRSARHRKSHSRYLVIVGIALLAVREPEWEWMLLVKYALYSALAVCYSYLGLRISATHELLDREVFLVNERAQARAKNFYDLLACMMPSEVVDIFLREGYVDGGLDLESSLQATAGVVPRAGILFASICDFDNIVKEKSDEDLANFLNTVYTSFDDILQTEKVTKIETVGDTYVCAVGLFSSEEENFQEQFDALTRAAHVFRWKAKLCQAKLRIGIHVGPVTHGVVGRMLPRFRLFGDSVNVTARLQQHCPEDSILLSEEAWKWVTSDVRGSQVVDKHEDIEMKGLGRMPTFLLRKAIKKTVNLDDIHFAAKDGTEKRSETHIRESTPRRTISFGGAERIPSGLLLPPDTDPTAQLHRAMQCGQVWDVLLGVTNIPASPRSAPLQKVSIAISHSSFGIQQQLSQSCQLVALLSPASTFRGSPSALQCRQSQASVLSHLATRPQVGRLRRPGMNRAAAKTSLSVPLRVFNQRSSLSVLSALSPRKSKTVVTLPQRIGARTDRRNLRVLMTSPQHSSASSGNSNLGRLSGASYGGVYIDGLTTRFSKTSSSYSIPRMSTMSLDGLVRTPTSWISADIQLTYPRFSKNSPAHSSAHTVMEQSTQSTMPEDLLNSNFERLGLFSVKEDGALSLWPLRLWPLLEFAKYISASDLVVLALIGAFVYTGYDPRFLSLCGLWPLRCLSTTLLTLYASIFFGLYLLGLPWVTAWPFLSEIPLTTHLFLAAGFTVDEESHNASAPFRAIFSAWPLLMLSDSSLQINITAHLLCCALSYQKVKLETISEEQQNFEGQVLDVMSNMAERLMPPMVVQEFRIKKYGKRWSQWNPSPTPPRAPKMTFVHSYELVSVLQADIVGFTALARALPSKDLLGLINRIFSTFDDRVNAHRVYKMETIGDAYVIISGLSDCSNHSILSLCKLALDFIDVVRGREINLNLRIGINSGPAVGSIVGTSTVRYHFLGNTIRIAEVLESTALVNTIHLSDTESTGRSSFCCLLVARIQNGWLKDSKVVWNVAGGTWSQRTPR
eukprot:GEMP01004489.1.p1 GENE.GEMP01004489.1~~GEMP01004489.1.p1  ORF type:complete len:1116 (+),score=159.50 GEMP01004489.1:210-3557(+)